MKTWSLIIIYIFVSHVFSLCNCHYLFLKFLVNFIQFFLSVLNNIHHSESSVMFQNLALIHLVHVYWVSQTDYLMFIYDLTCIVLGFFYASKMSMYSCIILQWWLNKLIITWRQNNITFTESRSNHLFISLHDENVSIFVCKFN